MPQMPNRSGTPVKRDQVALPRRVDVEAIDAALDDQQNQINQKANASTVGGLATAVNSKASQSSVDTLAGTVAGKADSATLTALAATVPTIADEIPQPEVTGGQAGLEGMKVPGARHQHPRLTSTTKATITAGSTVQVAFTRTFVNKPGITCTEEPPDTGTMSSNPATFRVESWVREVMTPTPSGAYTGCVIKVWRSRPLPTMTPLSLAALLTAVVTGVNALIAALTNYDIFGANAVGTTFSCIAIQRSDVA
ncbi:hypothetical protein ASE85_02465 [Sphingobium sp. Leaf26]|uniref:hypothetical protein n=1 Tax=Sphingobium sp. Leaf26 TaxID=1735693 RepID=UPI0006F66D3B|nr:hypothetical protein [Sphingobium sp. Leaf26]KQN09818.1 hypothetical protein ASE85_02465 [Sphingobium sp. Leaf26]